MVRGCTTQPDRRYQAAVARRKKVGQIFGFDADFRALGFDVQPG